MQALIVRTTAESGDGIVRFRPRLPQDNFRVPLQLQVLEGDFLDNSRTMGIATGQRRPGRSVQSLRTARVLLAL